MNMRMFIGWMSR